MLVDNAGSKPEVKCSNMFEHVRARCGVRKSFKKIRLFDHALLISSCHAAKSNDILQFIVDAP